MESAPTDLTTIISNTLSTIKTVATILTIDTAILAILITIVGVWITIIVMQERASSRRIKQIEGKIQDISAKYQELKQELKDKDNLILRKQYLRDLNDDDPTTRLRAIDVLSEIGDDICIAPLLKIIKNQNEVQDNVKAAEDAINSIVRRNKEVISEPILSDLGIREGYTGIILRGIRRIIDNMQKQSNLKKSKRRRK